MLGNDDDTTVIDLRRHPYLGHEHARDMAFDSTRRMSESTNSMSSYGPFADLPQFEDSPSSDKLQVDSDWGNFEAHPTSSPRPSTLLRSASRSRVSPAPSLRTSPYTLESTRNKRWSTGMYPGQPIPSNPQQMNRYSSYFGPQSNPQNMFATMMTEPVPTLPTSDYLPYPSMHLRSNGTSMYQAPDAYPEISRPLPSQGIFRLLSSNADRTTGCYSHYADLSDPPDLYSSLNEKPTEPPEEDMKPSDPDLVPHEQELRFPGDLYTPKWVRGQGNKREGWCGLCKPGRWLVLKNSAFWYDKSFAHGVSAATGVAFQSPRDTRRTEGNLDVWEGLCGSCNDWIALVSSKKKGTTWFRHAYKCHTHAKVKDGPKRKREAAIATIPTDRTATTEPIITISSSTPTPSSENSQPRQMDLDSERAVQLYDEQKSLLVKVEDDATPVSTPQLSHTSLPTPQPSWTQTPISIDASSVIKKRFSMMFDEMPSFAPILNRLETYSEQDPARPSREPHDAPVDEFNLMTDYADPSIFMLHGDCTFSPSTRPISAFSELSNNHTAPNEVNAENSIYFSPSPNVVNTTQSTQDVDCCISQPPEGNWI